MFIDKLLNKPVRTDHARPLKRNHNRLDRTLFDIYWCYERTNHQEHISPTELIMIESKWTDSMLKLLSLGNSTVMRSIRYGLREKTPEEDGEDRED